MKLIVSWGVGDHGPTAWFAPSAVSQHPRGTVSRMRRTSASAAFIRPQVASKLYRADGRVETERRMAVWTLAHRGYSGGGRLDVWVYRTRREALFAGADLAMEAGMDDDPQCRALFAASKYTEVLRRYEQTHPDTHLLRVQAAFLQDDQLDEDRHDEQSSSEEDDDAGW